MKSKCILSNQLLTEHFNFSLTSWEANIKSIGKLRSLIPSESNLKDNWRAKKTKKEKTQNYYKLR